MLLVPPPEYPCSLPTKATTTNLTVHPECKLASQRACEYVVNLNELHTTLPHTISWGTKALSGPMDCWWQSHAWLQNWWAKYLWGQNTLTLLNPPKNSPRSTLAHLTSLQEPGTHSVTIHLPDHLCTIHPRSLPCVPNWNSQLWKTKFWIIPNLLHLWLKSTRSLNMKSLKSSTPKLTTKGGANSYTLGSLWAG